MRPWIRHRANGRWYLSVIDDEGIEHPHGGYRTRREAQARYQELVEGGYIAPSSDTLGGYLQLWLATREAADLAPGTLALDRINVHTITAIVGDVPLRGFGTREHAKLRAELLRTRAAKTVRNIEGTLRKALTDATRWRPKPLLHVNPLASVRPPRIGHTERDAWTADQVHRFLEVAAEDRLGAIWRLALATGLRRGELLGLQWSDFGEGIVTVRRQVLLPGPYVRETTKSRRERTVRFDDATGAALRQWRARQAEDRLAFGPGYKTHGGLGVEAPWVMTEPDGVIINPDTLLRRWRALVAVAGVKPIPLHGARHTYATLALDAKVRLDIVSRQLGHSSVAITADVYGHADDEALKEAARKVADVLGKGTQG